MFFRIDVVTVCAHPSLLLICLVAVLILVVGHCSIVASVRLVLAHDLYVAKPAAEVASFFAVPALHLRVFGLSAAGAMPISPLRPWIYLLGRGRDFCIVVVCFAFSLPFVCKSTFPFAYAFALLSSTSLSVPLFLLPKPGMGPSS